MRLLLRKIIKENEFRSVNTAKSLFNVEIFRPIISTGSTTHRLLAFYMGNQLTPLWRIDKRHKCMRDTRLPRLKPWYWSRKFILISTARIIIFNISLHAALTQSFLNCAFYNLHEDQIQCDEKKIDTLNNKHMITLI